jgi:hypothetical protein
VLFRRLAVKGALPAVALLLTLIGASAALAASALSPTLGHPNRRRVREGRITLQVRARDARLVFVSLRPQRRIRHGHLVQCVSATGGCLVAQLRPVRHHPGLWSYRAPGYRFRGFWATTPRRYYWQAQSFTRNCSSGACDYYSRVGTFQVVR